MIDEDIIAQLGFTSLDDYIGDPGSLNEKSYPDLIQRARDYWKKYSQSNDVNAFINMFTLFDLSFFKQLEQLLPARANKLTGILIQPNILERSKDTILPTIEKFNDSYNVTIQNMDPTASADYPYYIGSVEGKIATLDAIDDDQYQMYLTASEAEKYNGTIYSYDYLIRSGSTYTTASSPYWRSEALNPTILDSVLSEIKEIVAVLPGVYGGYSYGAASYSQTGSMEFAQVQDYLPTGVFRQRYDGSKLTSADFNIVSRQTVDNGAPVEVRSANPNQLIYQDNGEQGSFVLVR